MKETIESLVNRMSNVMPRCESLDFLEAIISMVESAIDKFNEKFEEKGDSWKELSPAYLRELLHKEFGEFREAMSSGEYKKEMAEIVDLINVATMLHGRLGEQISSGLHYHY